MNRYWICEECADSNLYPDVKICQTCGAEITNAAKQQVLAEIKEEERREEQKRKEAERRRQEEIRRKREAEIKRRQEEEAAQRAEEERQRLAIIERKLFKRKAKERTMANYFRKTTNTLAAVIKYGMVAMIVISVVVSFVNSYRVSFDGIFSGVTQNIQSEYYAHTVVVENTGEQLPEGIPADAAPDLATANVVPDGTVTPITPEAPLIPEGESEADTAGEKRTLKSIKKLSDTLIPVVSGAFHKIANQISYTVATFHPVENIVQLIDEIVEYISGG